nr:uncharacterized protein LOC112423503 [Macaca nemestrina]
MLRKPSSQETPLNFRRARKFPGVSGRRGRKRRCPGTQLRQLLEEVTEGRGGKGVADSGKGWRGKVLGAVGAVNRSASVFHRLGSETQGGKRLVRDHKQAEESPQHLCDVTGLFTIPFSDESTKTRAPRLRTGGLPEHS